MSVRYLLPCSCGATVPVTASQAGGSVACGCGAKLDVPRLRDLQQLSTEASAAPAGGGWSFGKGVLSAGLLLAAALAGVAGWYAAIEPAPPTPFDAPTRKAIVDESLDKLPPVELWKLFHNVYAPVVDRGFEVAKSPADQVIQQRIATTRLYRNSLLIAAGVVVAVTVLLFALSPKSKREP